MPAFNTHTDIGVLGSEMMVDQQASANAYVALRDAVDAGSNAQITRVHCEGTRTR